MLLFWFSSQNRERREAVGFVAKAMGCFFGCFGIKESRSNPIGSPVRDLDLFVIWQVNFGIFFCHQFDLFHDFVFGFDYVQEPVVYSRKNALSSLFVSDGNLELLLLVCGDYWQ